MAPHIKPALESPDFTTDAPPDLRRRLTACLNVDTAHIPPGSSGPEVKAIQDALKKLRRARLDFGLPDIVDPPGHFDDSTVAAVRRYKEGGNGSGERIVRGGAPLDDTVGRMTITQLDDDLLALPKPAPSPKPPAPPPSPPPPPVTLKADVIVGHMGPAEPRAHVILDYYKHCGLETIGPAQVEVGNVSRCATFEALLDALIASSTLMTVVVNHGDPANGLIVKFCPETTFRHTGLVIGALKELADRRAFKPLDMADPDTKLFMATVTRQANVPRAVVIRIVDKLVALRRKPRIVHLRACNQKTSFMALRYKSAFGAIALSFHGTRLIFQRLDPKIPVNNTSVAQLSARLPANDQVIRRRLYQDSLGEFADMIAIIEVVLNENGDAVKEDSRQFIDRRNPADLDGWAKILIRRWDASTRKGFIVPFMWPDEDDLTFYGPLDEGWRKSLQFV